MAGPRPPFQAPFSCGQTWDASTYDDHWPNQNSIDLVQRDDDGTNISEGEPVLASADGTVLNVFTASNGSHRVYLDHDQGWVTYYSHLEEVPPLVIGQSVGQGEQIGRTGNSGTEAMHLHYTQLRDGKAVRASFNGELIDTHAGNIDSYDTWGSDNAERITSLNCTGNSFMRYSHSGRNYLLLYRPSTAEAKIVELGENGAGVTTTWEDQWTRGWTHLTPFWGETQWHAIVYKSSTGRADFLRMNLWGEGVTRLASKAWGKGWTHFVPFRRGDRSYFLAYNSLYGYANIDRINRTSDGCETLYQRDNWVKGRTQIVPFELGPTQYMLLYTGGTGDVKIIKIASDITVSTVWAGTWTRGWTHVVPIPHQGVQYLVAYKTTTGRAKILKLRSNGEGVDTVGTMSWTDSWTALSPFIDVSQGGHVLLYKAGTGASKTVRLKPGGVGVDPVWSGSWTRGWA